MSFAKLLQEVDNTIAIYERTNGALAARTRKMIAANGVVDALSKLVITTDAQRGFKVLRDSNQLDRTFEAVIVRFPEFFAKAAVESAHGAWTMLTICPKPLSNSALLTDAFSSLRCACGAAKRER